MSNFIYYKYEPILYIYFRLFLYMIGKNLKLFQVFIKKILILVYKIDVINLFVISCLYF